MPKSTDIWAIGESAEGLADGSGLEPSPVVHSEIREILVSDAEVEPSGCWIQYLPNTLKTFVLSGIAFPDLVEACCKSTNRVRHNGMIDVPTDPAKMFLNA